MSSGASITETPLDLTLAASWTGDGLRRRILSSVQNTGENKVHIAELATAPTALTDTRWQFIAPGDRVELMDGGTPIWARCASGETSTLAARATGRPTRQL